MDLAAAMIEVAEQLRTIAGLNVFDFPPGTLSPPAAVVTYPSEYIYDATYGRGMDRMTLPIVLVVGKADDRSTRDALGAYCDGSGVNSIKAALDDGEYTEFDTARVMTCEFDVVSIAGTEYMAAMFAVDIAGSGA